MISAEAGLPAVAGIRPRHCSCPWARGPSCGAAWHRATPQL